MAILLANVKEKRRFPSEHDGHSDTSFYCSRRSTPNFLHCLHLYTYICPYNTGGYNMSCLTVNFSGENRSQSGLDISSKCQIESLLVKDEKLLRSTRFRNFPTYAWPAQISSHRKYRHITIDKLKTLICR